MNIEHPKQISINGYTFKVIAYCRLTDQEAYNVALSYFQTHRLTKIAKKKIISIHTIIDEDSKGLFEGGGYR